MSTDYFKYGRIYRGIIKSGEKMKSGLLTIDDFPSKNTPAIVDYLKEKNINLFAPDIR